MISYIAYMKLKTFNIKQWFLQLSKDFIVPPS